MRVTTLAANPQRFFSRRDVAQPGSALAWGARGRRFKSGRPDQFWPSLLSPEVLRCAQDFGARLRRRASASSSNPAVPTSSGPAYYHQRSFAALRISARGSDAAQAPQVQIRPSRPVLAQLIITRGPSLRSGFRRAAQTPRKRLKFKSGRPDQFWPSLLSPEVLRCAQDFGARLRRRASASSSNPAVPTSSDPAYYHQRSFAALRISARGSDAAQAPQVQIRPSRPVLAQLIITRGPSLRSGFRRAAQTPRKRLKFKSGRPDQFWPSLLSPEVLRCAQDFGARLRRRASASSSNPAVPTSSGPAYYHQRSFAALRISAHGSDAAPAPQVQIRPSRPVLTQLIITRGPSLRSGFRRAGSRFAHAEGWPTQ